MQKARTSTLVPKTALWLGAALLLASMAAHAVIPHEHQHFAFGDGIAAATHGEERKAWFAVLLLGFLPAGAVFAAVRLSAFARVEERPESGRFAAHPLLAAFQKGILHPKLCG
ncbi:MAG TPA: hypothetical protein VL426_07415 [Candidatus Binatia bacterium]|jgi:hypothetical protein|nr:hypothetical protein [Candidatus Binatia bacterium]